MDADLGSNGRHIVDWPRLPRSSGALFSRRGVNLERRATLSAAFEVDQFG